MTLKVALSLGLIVAAAGCLGHGDNSKHYSLAASRGCFTARGDATRREEDLYPKASWLTVDFSDYHVFLGFASSETEATRLKSKIVGEAVPPIMRQEAATKGNVVYYSQRPTMPRDMRENIEACFK